MSRLGLTGASSRLVLLMVLLDCMTPEPLIYLFLLPDLIPKESNEWWELAFNQDLIPRRQFLDIRQQADSYLTIDAHRGSLTALAVHRNAPIIASGSAKQFVKIFSLKTIWYYPTFMAQKIGSVSCLTFHPYQVLLAAGNADAFISIYTDDISPEIKCACCHRSSCESILI
ncbi:Regulatory-associated protein of TOR 1-like protein [Drosera capensis]